MEKLISMEAAIDAAITADTENHNGILSEKRARVIDEHIRKLPLVHDEIIRCKDCRWWDMYDDNINIGYCMAMKHGYMSSNWEIGIYRKYKGDFYCADAELRLEEEGEDEVN